jgi:hypothetical protein
VSLDITTSARCWPPFATIGHYRQEHSNGSSLASLSWIAAVQDPGPADAAGLQAGTIYPIVRRLEDLGWLTARWEDIDEQAEGCPRRRYYRLTGDGLPAARQALAEADLRRRRAGRLPKRQESPGW